MPSSTKERILDSTAELFRRQGYAGTGVKAILAASQAPYGSLYHFFPGGKEELGVAALRAGGVTYRELVEALLPTRRGRGGRHPGLLRRRRRDGGATGYADACPIATVALEVASTSEPMREAAAEVFESWLAVLAERFEEAGIARRPRPRAGVLDALAARGCLPPQPHHPPHRAAGHRGDAAVALVRSALEPSEDNVRPYPQPHHRPLRSRSGSPGGGA